MKSSNKMYYFLASFWVDTPSGSCRNVSLQTLYFADLWIRLMLKIIKMMTMRAKKVQVIISIT